MKYKLYSLIFLLLIFSCTVVLGHSMYGILLLFLGAISVAMVRREIAFLFCLAAGGLFVSVLVDREINVFIVASFPLLIFAFWEMLSIHKMYQFFGSTARQVADRRAQGIFFFILYLFAITLFSHILLVSFTLPSPLFLVVMATIIFLVSLYLFQKDL